MFNIQKNEPKFSCWNKYLFNTEPLIDDWLEGLKSYVKQQENLIKAKDEFYMPFIGNCYIQNCISLLILGFYLQLCFLICFSRNIYIHIHHEKILFIKY